MPTNESPKDPSHMFFLVTLVEEKSKLPVKILYYHETRQREDTTEDTEDNLEAEETEVATSS